eukprot:gnl/MRDRNA2_/MRDRNA2_122423_c0_seq1.p1 gnl/MRDRNA2_/MRDRNA2_122423_c0~~gnl/MRDRNA2_/MRDRNA2_122423_c0_seq1.p1  ORF type:complete len:418 (+),score=63.45 gnl/MRDRNA2_/MRDRNA2_122423_c0_seq1:130-1383(+)
MQSLRRVSTWSEYEVGCAAGQMVDPTVDCNKGMGNNGEDHHSALPVPEAEKVLRDRAQGMVALIQNSEVRLAAGLPRDGKVASFHNAMLFSLRYLRMVRQRGADISTPRIAFHWTAESNFRSIAESNLRVPDGIDVRRKNGAAFGHGIYTCPDFRTAKEDFSHGTSSCFMCLVLTGRQQIRQPRSEKRGILDLPAEFDSIRGRLSLRPCDTWVLPEADMVLPCFLVDELALKEATLVLRAVISLLCEPWPEVIVGVGSKSHEHSASQQLGSMGMDACMHEPGMALDVSTISASEPQFFPDKATQHAAPLGSSSSLQPCEHYRRDNMGSSDGRGMLGYNRISSLLPQSSIAGGRWGRNRCAPIKQKGRTDPLGAQEKKDDCVEPDQLDSASIQKKAGQPLNGGSSRRRWHANHDAIGA